MGRQMRDPYDQWRRALSEEFFGVAHALQSTVLYVDDEVERELAEQYGIEVPLAQAVSDQLCWDRSDIPLFSRIVQRCRLWKSGGQSGAPPSLPVLAASVLAATRMVTSDGMRRTNFRGRWYQLFDVPQKGHQANRLDRALDDVAAMWKGLDAWLDATGGLYGASTVSTDAFYWRVGYPVSQALVRRSDRQELTRFFATTRLHPRNATGMPGRELLRRLTTWSAGRDRHLSQRFMEELRFAADPSNADENPPLIVSLLERLANDWDGTLHEPERAHRRRAVGLRIAVTDNGRRLEWLADAAEGVEETSVSFHDGTAFTLRTDYGGVYTGLETLQPSEPQLRLGVKLEGDDLFIEWVPQEVILLRMHPDLGEWVSTEYFEPGEQHCILASLSAAAQVRSMLGSLGRGAVRESAAAVPGWRFFKNVRAADGFAFTRALDAGGEHIHVLQPQVRNDAELIGGLRIAREYRAGAGVAGHYLRGAVPDLVLPTPHTLSGTVEVTLDGRTSSLRTDPRTPFPLHQVPLEEGQHEVGTASSSQIFTVHDGFSEGLPQGTGRLGYLCNSTSAGPHVSASDDGLTYLKGAAAPATLGLPRSLIVKKRVLEAYFITPHGGVVPARSQSPPPWVLNRVPEAATEHIFEAEAPQEAVWFVYRTSQRWWVRAVDPRVQAPDPDPSPDDYRWAYAVLSADAGGRCGTAGWFRYVEAARAISRISDGSAE
ncbi:hypothetical protein [Streptomyces sp. NPDC050738]|uniref:hypothetical protein n=1 Tax=Streptomyces sp. NPDC050738 TaxID=3154744 RepID=UPI0034316010